MNSALISQKILAMGSDRCVEVVLKLEASASMNLSGSKALTGCAEAAKAGAALK